jgi:hypothetical protein
MATKFTGFADLKDPRDLVLKLQHDISRIAADPGDSYAAFDFFVTAEHILDWLHPDYGGRAARDAIRNSEAILKITSHIANGAKHFVASNSKHKSVASIEQDLYVEPGHFEDDYMEEPIVIKLTPDEAVAFGCSQIDAIALAYQVLAYWQSKISATP